MEFKRINFACNIKLLELLDNYAKSCKMSRQSALNVILNEYFKKIGDKKND